MTTERSAGAGHETAAEVSVRPLIHVGYPKCASTFLQDRLFYPQGLGFHRPGKEDRALLFEELILNDGFGFDADASRDRFERMAGGAKGVVVWSEETLVGDPMQRRYNGGDVARRMKAIFPDARVLMIVREQRAMAISCYRQYVREGGRHSIEDFIGTGSEPLSFHPILRPRFLQYARPVAQYQELFGSENVLVLPFEELVSDVNAGADTIRKFASAEADERRAIDEEARNPGLKGLALATVQRLNPLRPLYPSVPRGAKRDKLVGRIGRVAARLPKGFGEGIERDLKEAVERRYAGLFTEDNKRLEQLIGRDLSALGYMT